eukprot:GFYU01012147.1.p1 GENE.GFYU01012147.1~~GFYU01012147.1.p1  ORF type:complete len:266 (+),score=49.87 GFYU01012147.1:102-899(+)
MRSSSKPLNFAGVRKTCQYYEEKAGGQYAANSRASKYCFDMSRDIQQEIAQLERVDQERDTHIRHLEQQLKVMTANGGAGDAVARPGVPAKVNPKSETFARMKKYEDEIQKLEHRLAEVSDDLQRKIDENRSNFESTLEQERKKSAILMDKELESLQTTHDQHVEKVIAGYQDQVQRIHCMYKESMKDMISDQHTDLHAENNQVRTCLQQLHEKLSLVEEQHEGRLKATQKKYEQQIQHMNEQFDAEYVMVDASNHQYHSTDTSP